MTKHATCSRKRVVHIISGDLWAGAEAQTYTLIKHLQPLCDIHAILFNEGTLATKLRTLGIPLSILDESCLNSWQILLQLRTRLKALKPDVVHTHRQKENILGALANASANRSFCIRTAHGAPEFNGTWKTTLQRKLDQWVGNHLQDAVIAVSSDLKHQLADRFPHAKVKVVHNGIDTEELLSQVSEADFKAKAPTKRHIGIIGRLVPVKRVDLFLDTAAVLNQDPQLSCHFHVIGEGPLRAALEQQAKELGLAEAVTFHGHRSDIPSCIHSMDAIVICSDHEGTPMVALESLALGTPVVAHKTGGLVEILSDHPNLLIQQQSAKAFASGVARILHSPAASNLEVKPCYLAKNSTEQIWRQYELAKTH